jgi:hypothetical protein
MTIVRNKHSSSFHFPLKRGRWEPGTEPDADHELTIPANSEVVLEKIAGLVVTADLVQVMRDSGFEIVDSDGAWAVKP